jgi:hypothetical protein
VTGRARAWMGALVATWMAACSPEIPRPTNLTCTTTEECTPLGATCTFDPGRGASFCCLGPACGDAGSAPSPDLALEDSAADSADREAPAVDASQVERAPLDAGADVAADVPQGSADAPAEDARPDARGDARADAAVDASSTVVIDPATFDLGAIPFGNGSIGNFAVLNKGASSVTLLSVKVIGDPDLLLYSDECTRGTTNATLGAGRFCTLSVSLQPQGAPGDRRGTLLVSTSAGPVFAELRGHADDLVDGAACTNFAGVWCARARACAPLTLEELVGRPEDCSVRLAGWCSYLLNAPGAQWNTSALEQCSLGLAGISCEEWRATASIFKGPLCSILGRRGPGEACELGSECSSLRCRHNASECHGVCEPRGGDGAACDVDADCAGGLVCELGKCQASGNLGFSCGYGRSCRHDLRCSDGVCAAPGTGGAPCTTDRDCDADDGWLCNTRAQACGRATSAATWDSAKPDGTVDRCRDGATPLSGGVCLSRLRDEQLCGTTLARCVFPATCVPVNEEGPRCRVPGGTSCPDDSCHFFGEGSFCDLCSAQKCCAASRDPTPGALATCQRASCPDVCP